MTVREQLVAWGVDVEELLAAELDVEAVDGAREGRLAREWVDELGREVLRRRTGRGPLAERHRAEREALEERHRAEREAEREEQGRPPRPPRPTPPVPEPTPEPTPETP